VTVACITPAEKEVKVSGRPARYLAAGLGPPLVLLHGTGTNRREWGWALPILARGRSVYAPDLPGFGGDGPANDASPEHSAEFVAGFADALGLGRAAVAGNSFGGLVALRLALSEPARVSALCLADSAGLGREVNPALVASTAPGAGELTVLWGKSPVGAAQRALSRVPLLFANPLRAPRAWYEEQYRAARSPGLMQTTIATLRANLGPSGQRRVLLGELSRLQMPTLVLWGARDRVFPAAQARDAVGRLRRGELALIPNCGHLPHVERPGEFAAVLGRFLDEHAPDA
jgi:2-hydroxy-6-oxonona-2,4-dienedioate hydrolase